MNATLGLTHTSKQYEHVDSPQHAMLLFWHNGRCLTDQYGSGPWVADGSMVLGLPTEPWA